MYTHADTHAATHTHSTYADMTYLIGVDMFITFGVQNILFLDLGDRAGVISGLKIWLSSMVIILFEIFKAINQIKQPRLKLIINGM